MLSYILLLAIICVTVYMLPLILVNGAILAVAVFLSRRKPSILVNILMAAIGLNQLRKGYYFWGIFFLILAIIKFLNLRKINMIKEGNYEEKSRYKKIYRENLLKKYMKFMDNPLGTINSIIDPKIKEIYDKYDLYEDDNGNHIRLKPEKVITLEDRERLNLYRQQSEVEKEVIDEIKLAYDRKEKRDASKALKYNRMNSNIPEDINQSLRSDYDKRYKNALENMLLDSQIELTTNKPKTALVKDFYEITMVDLRDTFESTFKWDNEYEDIQKSAERDYMNQDIIPVDTMNRFEEIDEDADLDVSWLEQYDIDLDFDINNIKTVNKNSKSLDDIEKDLENNINKINIDRINNEMEYKDRIYEEDRNIYMSKRVIDNKNNVKRQYSSSFLGEDTKDDNNKDQPVMDWGNYNDL